MNLIDEKDGGVTPQKLLETPTHFIINGQVYDKHTFNPVPLKFFTVNTIWNRFITLNNSVFRSNNSAMYDNICEKNENNIIKSNTESDIFFLRTKYETNAERLFKIKHQNGKYEVLNTFNYSYRLKILVNTEDFFITKSTISNTTFTYDEKESYLFFVHKNNLSTTTICTVFMFCFLLDETAANAYILQMNNKGVLKITDISLSNKTYTDIWTYNNPTEVPIYNNSIKIKNNYFILICSYIDKVYRYQYLKISINNNELEKEIMDIDKNDFDLEDKTLNSYGPNTYHTQRIIKANGKTFISVLVHGDSARVDGKSYVNYHKIILFEYTENNIIVRDVIKLEEGCCGSLLYYDSSHILIYQKHQICFYNFNLELEKYVCDFAKVGRYECLGFDMYNRLILMDTKTNIEMLTEGNAVELKADFEEEIYNKEDRKNIETNVVFYVKNFLGKKIETSVTLDLIGNAVFKENNSKTINLKTSNITNSSTPVLITGGGRIQVIISLQA